MKIGNGSHTYEWVEDWGKLPEDVKYGFTHGVVEDSRGRIFIHSPSPSGDSVVVFEADGTFISSWGNEYAAGAHGMFLNKEGDQEFLYLSATKQNFVAKTTLEGKEVWRVGQPDLPNIYDGEKKKFVPTEATVGPNGIVYVADGYGQPYVHMYSTAGEYKGHFGGPGDGEGQLANCHGIMIDTRGSEPLVLVSDRGNSRLQYFTLDGKFVKITAKGIVRKPCTTVQYQDEIYIPDLHSRLTVLDKDDNLICHLGEREEGWKIEGWPNIAHDLRQVGNFTSPHDMHVDGQGNIYVAEWINDGRVTKLKRC